LDRKSIINKILENIIAVVLIVFVYKMVTNFGTFLNGLKSLAATFSPFFYGFLLAYVLDIPCSKIQQLLCHTKNPTLKKYKKGISILSVYFLLLILIVFVLYLIVPSVYESLMLFFKNFDRYYQRAEEILEEIYHVLPFNTEQNLASMLPAVQDFSIDRLFSSVNALVGVSASIFKVFLVLISSVYSIIEKDRFKAFLNRILKAFIAEKAYKRLIRYANNLNMNFKQYIYTQTLDGCILGTLAGIELAMLKSQFALVLGIMLGIVNYIPYFGSIAGTMVTVLIVMFSQSIPVGLLALLILLITQQIDGNIIQPKLMSSSFSISPLLVIISVTAGGAAAGVLGMLAAIPITVTLLNIFEDILTHYELKRTDKNTPKSRI
jgi:predicted PurR-regulated permease PerM